jgi:hypothetical protein
MAAIARPFDAARRSPAVAASVMAWPPAINAA